MHSFKSTFVSAALFTAVACFALALLAPVNAAPEPSIALASHGLSVDARAFAPDAAAARLANGAALRRNPQIPLGPYVDADGSRQRLVAVEAVAASRLPSPGPGALLVAGLIGVGAIAWRRATSRPNGRLDASAVLR